MRATKRKSARRRTTADAISAEDQLALLLKESGRERFFSREYHFAKGLGRDFRADFGFPCFSLLVEVQGGIWRRGGGAHSRPANIERDIEKAQYAAILGYTLLPVTPADIKSGQAMYLINSLLLQRGLR